MDILWMMLLVSLGLAFCFLGGFIWANRQRQFDDLVTPAWRAVFDDEQKVNQEEKNEQ